MIAAKSFEFLSLAEDSAVTDLDYSSGHSSSPPDYEEVADLQQEMMAFNLHSDTMYSIKPSPSSSSSGGRSNQSSSSLEFFSPNSQQDPRVKLRIMESSVYCIHRAEGCAWRGRLAQLKGHLITCQKDAILCVNACGAKIARVNMADHMMYTCSQRILNCVFCKRPHSGGDIEEHQNACGFEPLYCENKCGQRVARNRLKAHMVNTCAKRLINCKYCGRSFAADTLQPHHVACPKFPVPCPNRCGENCRREEVEAHRARCGQALAACPHAELGGCSWRGHPSVVEQHLLDSPQVHLDLLARTARSQQAYIQRLKQELERASLSKDGVLVWKISGLAEKLAEAKTCDGLELVSRPFYTSAAGYKLQVSLFPGGNGGGEDTHLSVYIKVLPGDYDSILKWPFRHTISFTLMDQNPDRQSAVNIVESFIPDPSWANFQRPSQVADPDQLGFGFPKFVPHGMLSLRNYVKDDTVYIKIRADPNKSVAV